MLSPSLLSRRRRREWATKSKPGQKKKKKATLRTPLLPFISYLLSVPSTSSIPAAPPSRDDSHALRRRRRDRRRSSRLRRRWAAAAKSCTPHPLEQQRCWPSPPILARLRAAPADADVHLRHPEDRGSPGPERCRGARARRRAGGAQGRRAQVCLFVDDDVGCSG